MVVKMQGVFFVIQPPVPSSSMQAHTGEYLTGNKLDKPETPSLPQHQAPVSGEHLTLHQNSDSAQADYRVPKDFKRTRNSSFNFIRKPKLPGTTPQHPPICGNSLVITSIPLWQEIANQPNLTQRFTFPSHLWNPRA